MQDNRTTPQFLAEDVYLPGWMLVTKTDYSGNSGIFTFNPREPEIARRGLVDYVTPRGLHVCISQAAYCLLEQQVATGKLDYSPELLRKVLLGSRVKIIELFERFRREVEISKPVQGKFILTKFRVGKIPLAKVDFDFDERAIQGNLIAIIAPIPISQQNPDLIRF